jgi:hypothetical protein
MTNRSRPLGASPEESADGERDRLVYCPLCQNERPRNEWIRVWRHVRSGTPRGKPAEVLKHRPCKEIVYVVMV